MIQTARENTPPSLANKVSFEVMRAQVLALPPSHSTSFSIGTPPSSSIRSSLFSDHGYFIFTGKW